MSLPIVLRAAARDEADQAARWYEGQRPGLGADFVAELQRVFDVISAHPDRCAVAAGDTREAPLSRFPYCVYYRVGRNRVVVTAVFHTARSLDLAVAVVADCRRTSRQVTAYAKSPAS